MATNQCRLSDSEQFFFVSGVLFLLDFYLGLCLGG